MKIILVVSIFIILSLVIFLAKTGSWSRTYSKRVKGLRAQDVWPVWTDINAWHTWQSDIEYAKLDGVFEVGNQFTLKPKGAPAVRISLIEVEENKVFTDQTKFPFATMFGKHEFMQHGDDLDIKTTIHIQGLLGFVWRKIVAEDVAQSMPEQTENLIKKVRHG